MKKIIEPSKETIIFNKIPSSTSSDIQNIEATISTKKDIGPNTSTSTNSSKSRCSIWKKIKSEIHEVCEMLQPLVSLLLPVCTTMSRLINSVANLRKYSGRRRGKRCVA